MSERESRATIASESPFNPLSLVGSWALYQGEHIEQALVVAEPNPGVYLVEVYDLVTDEPVRQRIVRLDDFAKLDDEGGTWEFFDSAEAIKVAFRRLFAHR
jgi:hypothetical protein